MWHGEPSEQFYAYLVTTSLGRINYYYVGVFVPATIVIPLTVSVVRYKKLPVELRIVSWYLILSAVVSVVFNALSYNNINNMPISHVYSVAEAAIFLYLYRHEFHIIGAIKNIELLVTFFVLVAITNALFFQSIFTYNTYTKSLESLIIMSLSIYYFKLRLDGISIKGIEDFATYVSSGLLLYFSGSLVWFTMYNMVKHNGVVLWSMLAVHATLLLVFYILATVGLWKANR